MKNKPIGYKIKALGKLFSETVKNKAGKGGINPSVFLILNYLRSMENKPVTQKDIASFLGFKPSSVSVLLKEMEQSNYIERVQSEIDHRALFIQLSDEGKEYSNSMKHFFLETDEIIEQSVTKEQYEIFCYCIDQMIMALEEELLHD